MSSICNSRLYNVRGSFLSLVAALAISFSSMMASVTAASAQNANELHSTLGSYLAGRIARNSNASIKAVTYYRHVLSKTPANPRILEQAFNAEATEGNVQELLKLARKLVRFDKGHRVANTWLGLAAFKAGKFKLADKHFKQAGSGPIGELTSALSRAWVASARQRPKDAYARLRLNQRAEWAQYYLRYHRALVSDLWKNRTRAKQNFARVFKTDPSTPRIAIGYLRHASNAQDFKLVDKILRANRAAEKGQVHPSVADIADKIAGRNKLELLISTPTDGLAEVYYGLGEALTTEGGMGLGAIYLQMALYLKPDFPFAQAAIANVYETTKRHQRANAVYSRITKKSPLQFSIALRRAANYDAMERTDEAKVILDNLAAQYPKDIRPLEAVANILRNRKRYREAIGYYDRIIDMVDASEPKNWTFWYARGTCYERTKDWPSAERDLVRANELMPNQALVLNYLGYSWVDQNINLQRGLKYIKKAVELKPDDGYIVDSLGWAHFRLGNFAEATKHLERAVELRPEDPILNDHLGDALWRVGRQREARYQWKQALTLKPEPENVVKIRKKLAEGLPNLSLVKSKVKIKAKPKALGKRAETERQTGPRTPIR